MSIIMNKELAVVGLIYAIAYKKIKDNDVDNNYPGDGIEIDPLDVMNYCSYLTLADQGAIIRNFNLDNLKDLFKSKKYLFKSVDGERFVINLTKTGRILPLL